MCGCYLKKIAIKQKYYVDRPFHRIYLHFLHESSGKWITKFISDLPREAFDNDEDYKKHKINTAKSLENLMACYISGAHIKHIMFENGSSGIVSLVEEIKQALTDNQFWDTEVCLKTVPNDDGGISVARFTPYMSYPNNTAWTLGYSKWELNKVTNYQKQ